MSPVVDAAISPADLAELEGVFDGADAPSVRQFILAHPSLHSLLLQARNEIAANFGPDTRAALAVVRDPEEHDPGILYAFVQISEAPDRALERLDHFNDRWWRATAGADPVPLSFVIEHA
jgi:hypothetical protein